MGLRIKPICVFFDPVVTCLTWFAAHKKEAQSNSDSGDDPTMHNSWYPACLTTAIASSDRQHGLEAFPEQPVIFDDKNLLLRFHGGDFTAKINRIFDELK